jgi:hypothetical protein
MSTNDSKNNPLPSFDDMMSLHQNDPEAFEQLRSRLLQKAIDDAPAAQRASLKGLVGKLDQVRAAAPSNYAAAQEAFTLMQQSVASLGSAMKLAQRELAHLQTTILLKQIGLNAALHPSRLKSTPRLRRHRDRM